MTMTRKRLIPRLLQFTLVVVGINYGLIVLFDVILKAVIPRSLLHMYMFFVFSATFMVFTCTEEGAKELVGPIKALVEDPSRKMVRNIVFAILPIVTGGYIFMSMQPSFEAPVELRSIHPAPPGSVKVYGKRYNLSTLENPYRKFEKKDPAKFKKLVNEGGKIYIRNCQYCHGDRLDGKGPYADGLNPTPLNFQDVGTIAQLQESFVFWRITTGGPGLPKEASPWLSAMPIWSNFLTEDQVWKVILFLYDYTGQRPRSWEK